MAKDSSPTRTDSSKSTATGDDKDKPPAAGDSSKSTATGDGPPPLLTAEEEDLAAARAPRIQSVLCAVEPIDYPLQNGKVGRIGRGEPLNGRLNAEQIEQLAGRGLVQHRML